MSPLPAAVAGALALALLSPTPPPSASAAADASPNLARNGDFELLDGGAPAAWHAAGSASVTQKLSSDTGRDGGRCARLDCTEYHDRDAASHAMIAQQNALGLVKGTWYRLRLWARQRGIEEDCVQVAINRTRPWTAATSNLGGFSPTGEWREFEFQFPAKIDVPADLSRLQFWFRTTGTLWIDDVALEPIARPEITPLDTVAPGPGRNLLPNASFECGPGGWGSIAKVDGWGGNLPALLGQIDPATSTHGTRSLHVRLGPGDSPSFHFDYFTLCAAPVLNVATVNLGWIPLEPGTRYTLSADLRSAPDNLEVALKLVGAGESRTRATPAWKRHAATFTARDRFGYASIAIDLPRQNLDRAALWIDAVQLERADQPTPFATRAPVEIELLPTGAPGNLLPADPPPQLQARAFNSGDTRSSATVEVALTDFFDRPAVTARSTASVIGPGEGCDLPISLWAGPESDACRNKLDRTPGAPPPPSPPHAATRRRSGFFRATVTTDPPDPGRTRRFRLAMLAPIPGDDSIFGVNHAYPWTELQAAKRLAGVRWTRDWSLKWHDVEPDPGRFTFDRPRALIRHAATAGDRVLGLLPFPSSTWASTAPADHAADNAYLQARERVAFKPRDPTRFEEYVARTVKEFAPAIRHWEILNEPLYTSYALPKRFGHSAADYVDLLARAHRAIKRVQPDATVIGGIADSIGPDYDAIIAAGALEHLDCLNFHTYPGAARPERLHARLVHLNDLARARGAQKPIWCTEYAYYADDDPPARPLRFEMPLVQSEKLAAAYFIRLSAILLAEGAHKLFYHAGTCATANSTSLGGFLFEHSGPTKVIGPLAALARLAGPAPSPRGRLPGPDGAWAFLFARPDAPFAIAWMASGPGARLRATDDRIQLLDIEGNPIPDRETILDAFPVYAVAPGLDTEILRSALAILPAH